MKVHVVGGGPSAVHFALAALERGHEVVMLDVGRDRPPAVLPDATFEGLKRELDDPVDYFLGESFEGLVLPTDEDEYYGFPPNKAHVFEPLDAFRTEARGFEPLASFARGGLAEAWTGGVYPFNDAELADWPFGLDALAPHYDALAGAIGVSGADDDLAALHPLHANLQPPLALDAHGRRLLERYERRRERFHALGVRLGRSRSAVLSEPLGERPACTETGRCLWTCPTDAFYTPLLTLRELLGRDGFEYRPGRHVSHFETDDAGAIVRVVCDVVGPEGATGEREEHEVERLVLGAGTLSTARIFLESMKRERGAAPALAGLMDNRQVLLPFVNLGLLGRRWEPESYQYHQLALALAVDDPRKNVHGLVTTLTTALIHPIVQSVPFDLRTALFVFRNVHGALGLLNVNLHDDRREENRVELREDGALGVTYRPSADEPARVRDAVKRFRRALRMLACVVPPGMQHERPMGASVHYCGTLPMTAEDGPLTTTPDGRSRDYDNLWVVDGSGFPFLPAKNLTFTLMANARRVAHEAF